MFHSCRGVLQTLLASRVVGKSRCRDAGLAGADDGLVQKFDGQKQRTLANVHLERLGLAEVKTFS